MITPFRLTVAARTSSVPSPLKTMTSTMAFGCWTPPTMLNPVAENTYEPRRVRSVQARRSAFAGGSRTPPDRSRCQDHWRPPTARRRSPRLPHTPSPPSNRFVAYVLPLQPSGADPAGTGPATGSMRAHLYRRNPAAGGAIRLRTGSGDSRTVSAAGGDGIDSRAVIADVTGLLQAWSGGDAEALDQLAPLVQRELREMARRMLSSERQAVGWQPTDLVQESYVRLLDWHAVHWQNRAHFFATTARMMRRVLVDAARARQAAKRGQGVEGLSLEAEEVAAPAPGVDIVALNDALAELATLDPRPSQVVELRFFGGFSVEETAETLGVSVRTVINDWNTARAWLHHTLAKRGRL